MAVIKQLNEQNGIVKAIVEVDGVMIPVEINKGFKSHLERNKEVVRKAEEYLKDNGLTSGDALKDARVLIHEVAVQGESPVDKVLNTLGHEVLFWRLGDRQ